MKTRYLKRFCFSPDSNWVKEYESSLSKPINKVFLGDLSIENIEVFKNKNHAFVILDLQQQSDIAILKTHLKTLSNKTKQIKLIETIIQSKTIKPLERIFKMIPQEDNLVVVEEVYKRSVMTLQLNTNETLLKAYKHIHKPEQVWPEIIKNMKTVGVIDMELYLDGYQAFLLMDTVLEFNMEKDGKRWANLPREKEWQNYVAKFQKVNPQDKIVEKWKVMELINKTR